MQIRRDFLRILEASIVGFFLIQTIRFLYAAMFCARQQCRFGGATGGSHDR